MFSFRGGYDEQGNIEALFKDPVEWSDDDTRLKDPTIAVDVGQVLGLSGSQKC